MQITETYHLTNWIKNEIEGKSIVRKYDALFNIFDANSKRPNNQPVQPFEDQKKALIDAITSLNVNVLTLSQLHVLDILNINQNIGSRGKRKLEDLLSNTLDIAHIGQQINEMKTAIQEGITKSDQLREALVPFIEEKEPDVPPDKVLTRVMFEHDASVKDIKELRDWTSKWFDIGRGFAMANGQTPEDIQVIGGARGSLIIELALLATTALPIAKAIHLTLDSMVKYRDYQLRSIEVRRLKKDSPTLADEFEEDAKRWEARAQLLKKEIADDISGEIKQHFSNYTEENQAELEKAVRTLVDFISKGGDVDCVITEETESEESTEELTETIKILKADFSYIRELKETLLLEHKVDADKSDETP